MQITNFTRELNITIQCFASNCQNVKSRKPNLYYIIIQFPLIRKIKARFLRPRDVFLAILRLRLFFMTLLYVYQREAFIFLHVPKKKRLSRKYVYKSKWFHVFTCTREGKTFTYIGVLELIISHTNMYYNKDFNVHL